MRTKNTICILTIAVALASNGMAVDVFVKCPFDFAEEYAKAKWMEFDGQKVPFIGLDCLLEMKKDAARPKDLADIECLKKAQDETSA